MNTITIELCAEDRARIDRLADAMNRRTDQVAQIVEAEAKKIEKATEAPKNATEDVEAPQAITTQPEEATPAEAPKAEPVKPSVTKEQIQKKVTQLAAGFGGTKKAAVRQIVTAYADKVTEIPADKWDEVWEKLTQLEAQA